MAAQDYFTALPTEMISAIVAYLPLAEQRACRMVHSSVCAAVDLNMRYEPPNLFLRRIIMYADRVPLLSVQFHSEGDMERWRRGDLQPSTIRWRRAGDYFLDLAIPRAQFANPFQLFCPPCIGLHAVVKIEELDMLQFTLNDQVVTLLVGWIGGAFWEVAKLRITFARQQLNDRSSLAEMLIDTKVAKLKIEVLTGLDVAALRDDAEFLAALFRSRIWSMEFTVPRSDAFKLNLSETFDLCALTPYVLCGFRDLQIAAGLSDLDRPCLKLPELLTMLDRFAESLLQNALEALNQKKLLSGDRVHGEKANEQVICIVIYTNRMPDYFPPEPVHFERDGCILTVHWCNNNPYLSKLVFHLTLSSESLANHLYFCGFHM